MGAENHTQFLLSPPHAKCSQPTELSTQHRQQNDRMATRQARLPQLLASVPHIKLPLHAPMRHTPASEATAITRPRRFIPVHRYHHQGHTTPGPKTTHFGFENVTEAEKTQRVAAVFASVAESYDRMNDLMSFGWHRIWKYVLLKYTSNEAFSRTSSLLSSMAREH